MTVTYVDGFQRYIVSNDGNDTVQGFSSEDMIRGLGGDDIIDGNETKSDSAEDPRHDGMINDPVCDRLYSGKDNNTTDGDTWWRWH
ncbi:hypothetical protein NUACC21_15910 [Scytonema sp. NUACC21]